MGDNNNKLTDFKLSAESLERIEAEFAAASKKVRFVLTNLGFDELSFDRPAQDFCFYP